MVELTDLKPEAVRSKVYRGQSSSVLHGGGGAFGRSGR
jgi:hypothetical protein